MSTNFGELIRILREEKAWSLDQVADALDLASRTSVWNWENNVNPPGRRNLFRLAALYGIDPIELESTLSAEAQG